MIVYFYGHCLTSMYICTVDDHNRVLLNPLPNCPDCQHDYINASYIDVSYSKMISVFVNLKIFMINFGELVIHANC